MVGEGEVPLRSCGGADGTVCVCVCVHRLGSYKCSVCTGFSPE